MTGDLAGLRNLLTEAQPISPLPQQRLLLQWSWGRILPASAFPEMCFRHWPMLPAPSLASIPFPPGRAASILKKPAHDAVESRAVFSTLVRWQPNLPLTRGSFLTDRNHSHEVSPVSTESQYLFKMSSHVQLAQISQNPKQVQIPVHLHTSFTFSDKD